MSQTEPSQPAGQEQAPVFGSQPPLTQGQTWEQSEPHIPSGQTKEEKTRVKTSLSSARLNLHLEQSGPP